LPDTSPSAAPVKKKPVTPRHAASLIIVRESRAGTELLMGVRGSKARFMPNVLVFPGGRVDPDDHKAPFATPLREDTHALLARKATPRLVRGLALAAARELEEETGLTLAPAPGAPPALDGLDYLCRAVTPSYVHMRFNARFLVTEADRVTGTLGGSGELEKLRWYAIDDALGHDLAGITRDVLRNLQIYLGMSPEQRRARAETPINQQNRWRME
jgi:8-oxo-dGTP pyrophosphatase MutT (NUDIX family)